jgi:2-keto-4-pentenoate hydratase/2-oxohepta-3-ene-1,7-dioic acid hydratase in catechol pathway
VELFQTSQGIARRAGDTLEILGGLPDLHDLIVLGHLEDARLAEASAVVPLDAARFRSPVRPGRLFQVGLNYRSHLAEIGRPVPDKPMYGVSDVEDTISDPDATVVFPPDNGEQVDHECEIAIVIGAAARHIAADDAWTVIAGLTACNDVSARDLQREGLAAGIMTAGKMLPGFKPLGPGLLTSDEAMVGPLDIALTVNGELRQHSTTDDMVFSIPRIVEIVSADHDLVPGDVIMTGSPSGVGFFTGKFLQSGDVVEITLGSLPPLRTTFTKG